MRKVQGTDGRVSSTNRAMTLFTSLGPSADCRGLTQVPTYRERTGHARGAAFSVSQRGFSLGWGLQGKVARTPHQSKGSGGTVCMKIYKGEPRRMPSYSRVVYHQKRYWWRIPHGH